MTDIRNDAFMQNIIITSHFLCKYSAIRVIAISMNADIICSDCQKGYQNKKPPSKNRRRAISIH